MSTSIAPPIGSLMYGYLGYRKTMDNGMIGLFTISVIYFIFNCGIDFNKNDKKFRDFIKNGKVNE